MKVIIAYPPLSNAKGSPTLGQNRQFQYFKEPTYIYPVVPAQAATLLKQAGHQVIWLDALAQNLNKEAFLEIVKREKPQIIAFETKTPVVKQHWKIIDLLKDISRDNWQLSTVLFGDHVTNLPEESFLNSNVDFVLTGGDYDFLLLNLCNVLSVGQEQGALEPGIYYRQAAEIKNSGKFLLNHKLDSLPSIDRELTHWKLYAFQNGNYKRRPGTYLMSGRDCWYHQCTFCSWPALYPEFRVRSVGNVLDEIGELISKYRIREIMDDTGTFPDGKWLEEFCNGMISRGYNKEIYLDCNMRFGTLTKEEFALMKKANFRLLLFGLESANQETLDRINKKMKIERVIEDCKLATRAGLFPHITIMFGYPWEDYTQALNTLNLGRWLLKKGYAYTMQATVVIPYPGSRLFAECKEKGWLRSLDWDDYDMKQPILCSPIPEDKIMELVRGMYSVSFQPEFILRKLFSLKSFDDLGYSLRAARKIIGHIVDFKLAK